MALLSSWRSAVAHLVELNSAEVRAVKKLSSVVVMGLAFTSHGGVMELKTAMMPAMRQPVLMLPAHRWNFLVTMGDAYL